MSTDASADAGACASASNAAAASNTSATGDASVQVIMRQTDYSLETAQQKLTEHNNDVMAVIREYMNPTGKKSAIIPPPKLSTNQQIYKEIRGWMDTAAKTYYQPTENK